MPKTTDTTSSTRPRTRSFGRTALTVIGVGVVVVNLGFNNNNNTTDTRERDDETRPMAAVRAMRARGISEPEALLEHASPEVIIATCQWWDGLKGVGTGLLVKKIRDGGVQPAAEDLKTSTEKKAAERIGRFNEYAARFPVGSVTELHARLEQRRWPGDVDENVGGCVGHLVVIAVSYPAIEVRCDRCAFEAAYPLRGLGQLPAEGPLATGLAEPEPHRPAPAETPTTSERHGGLRRHPRIPGFEP